jgi:trimeric autotransporter adhesin
MKSKLHSSFFVLALLALFTLNSKLSNAHAQGTLFTYQGQVLDNDTNFTGAGQFKFALVTSTNVAARATATANPPIGGFITIIDVTFGGHGYTTAPAVTISGGGGSGATATATVSGGAVTAITVANPGSGYTSTPTVAMAPPPADLDFTTFWSNDGTSANGSEPSNSAGVAVVNGLFTVVLGDTNLVNMTAIPVSVFTEAASLQLLIWFNDGVNGFAALSPVQNLTPAPYAIVAGNASNLLGTLPTAQLRGPVASANLIGGYSNAITLNNASNLLSGSFTGNGAGLTNLHAWALTGNSGTSPTNGDFVGTADDQPLELHVNGGRAFRLEPTLDDANHSNIVNVLCGSPVNFLAPGTYGATISGGGAGFYADSFGPGTNSVSADFGTVGGGFQNAILGTSLYATIGGGVKNTIQADGEYATIAGGEFHTIVASRGTIAGGDRNTIDAGADWSAISGGQFNIITNSQFSDIDGGQANSILDSSFVTISGGLDNVVQLDSSFDNISGGQSNVIQSDADHATIGGGGYNTIIGSYVLPVYSTIGGGEYNSIQTNSVFSVIGGGSNNSCSGEFDTLPGGIDNLASGDYATVGGGSGSIASGEFATVPGGSDNLAQGNYSLAAGNSAQALHQGAFVWADSSGPGFPSVRNDQFRVHANGGVRFDLDDTADIITRETSTNWVEFYGQNLGSVREPNIVVINTSTGAYLSVGGSWVNSSDRKLKENFAPVNGRETLEKVAALPITRWNYKAEGESVQHIGPVAQDFQAAFQLSHDDKHISTVDEGGVALAAIQGLNQKLNEKDAEIKKLKEKAGQVDLLAARVEELEAAVKALAGKK